MRKKLLLLIALPLLFLFFNITCSAKLAIDPVIPDNQVDKSLDNFDLRLAPNQKQTLIVKMSNESDKKQKVKINVDNAITNENGVIDYSNSKHIKKDPSLKYDLNKLAKYSKEEELSPHSTIDFPIEIIAPSEEFTGIILGGILFEEVDESESKTNVKNEIFYDISITLRGKSTKVDETLKLNKVIPTTYNSYSTFFANLQNPIAGAITNMKSEVKIYNQAEYQAFKKSKKNKPQPLYEDKKNNQTMAPNSNFNYNFQLNSGETFKAGNYTWVMNVKSMQGEWNFEKNFTITQDEVNRIKEKDVTIPKPDYLKWILLGLAILLVMIIVALIVRKQMRTHKELKELRSKVNDDQKK